MQLDSVTFNKTRDYKKFRVLKGNRRIQDAHVARLMEAFTEDASISSYNPILINEKWEIIDGQHRYEALKQLDLPVYYMMQPGLDISDTIDLNTGKKSWRPDDYAYSFMEQGKDQYETYLWFKDEYGLNHDVLMRYLSLDAHMTTRLFKEGQFVVPDADESEELCNALQLMAPYYNRWNNRSFALGFFYLWTAPDYDHDKMLRQLQSHRNAITDRGTPAQYLEMLEKVYNAA